MGGSACRRASISATGTAHEVPAPPALQSTKFTNTILIRYLNLVHKVWYRNHWCGIVDGTGHGPVALILGSDLVVWQKVTCGLLTKTTVLESWKVGTYLFEIFY